MQKNSILQKDNQIYRTLDFQGSMVFVIDCVKRTMPRWIEIEELEGFCEITKEELYSRTNEVIRELGNEQRRIAQERFTMIAGVLPFIQDTKKRSEMLHLLAKTKSIQTIRKYLCLYLIYQDIEMLAPKDVDRNEELSDAQKNIRWALNKYYYTKNKNSLRTAYAFMLKGKYTDEQGRLLDKYPTWDQFRYFYRTHRRLQQEFISRNGIKDYQKNHRPLLGDSVQAYSKNIGMGMLDSTIADIYIVDEAGKLIGRPILTVCVDAQTHMCMGYFVSWSGGVYSLRGLMLNLIEDKVEHCRKFGITIEKDDWNCDKLPSTLICDKGKEYTSENFAQLCELGLTVVDLPAYRGDLKGIVERFFGLVQDYFKPHLKNKGVIEPDFQERGARDYRKDACLTMQQFQTILIRCILYYNNKRVLENYPYTSEMIERSVKPFSSAIWNYELPKLGTNLISITKEQLILTLAPRTKGKFSRKGLQVNGLRYKNNAYIEQFLKGGTISVAYNPDDVSFVWLIEGGEYVRFELIESRFASQALVEVQELQKKKKEIVKAVRVENLQAQIELANHIEAITSTASKTADVDVTGVRKNRERARSKTHIDYMKQGGLS